MTTPRKCPTCSAELAADVAQGLCPQCLLKQGMESATRITRPAAAASAVEPIATQTISPEHGTKVRYFGDYELLDEVARGGMGVIYKARQASLNRTVALKMILSGQLATEAEVKRFHVEAEAAANLQHPNIVAIHEVGMHEGRHYFTMDFVEGRNLAQLAGGRPLPAVRAAGYVKTIAEAIHFAHQRGTLHRDLKPQNVLIDTLDHVRITDFGLAKQTRRESSLTLSGVVMGSPSYMPPEQAQGRQDLVGPHSDVYALGAILYELLTGQPPFRADSPLATLAQVIDRDPVRPSTVEPTVPRDLETVCLKCLEKHPERRYPTARALAEELERFLQNEPILARPASAVRKAVSWSRRHRALMTALLSAVILALAGLAYGLWQQTLYLTWLNVRPGTVRAPGARTAALNQLTAWGSFGFVVLAYTFACYWKRSRNLPWRDLIDPLKAYAPPQPIPPRQASAFAVAGGVAVAWSLWPTAKAIEAYVWECPFPWQTLFVGVYPLFYFGLMLMRTVIREQATATFGLAPEAASPALPQAQFAPVRQALYAGRREEAIALARELTGLSLREAEAMVGTAAQMLYREHPGRFADPTVPPPLRRGRLALLGLGVGFVLALALPFFPPRLYPSWPIAFAVGTGSGACFVLVGWHRRFWAATLGVLPLLTSGIVTQVITSLCNPGMNYWLPLLLGIFAGMALVRASRRDRSQSGTVPGVAGVAGVAAQAPAVVSSAAAIAATAVGGAVVGTAGGLAGAYFGAKASIENTRTPRERQFMVRMTRWCAAGVVAFCVMLFALIWLGRQWLPAHPGWFAAALTALIVVYVASLFTFIAKVNRRQRQIQSEDSTATAGSDAGPPATGSQP